MDEEDVRYYDDLEDKKNALARARTAREEQELEKFRKARRHQQDEDDDVSPTNVPARISFAKVPATSSSTVQAPVVTVTGTLGLMPIQRSN
jgi:hypothetical protein